MKQAGPTRRSLLGASGGLVLAASLAACRAGSVKGSPNDPTPLPVTDSTTPESVAIPPAGLEGLPFNAPAPADAPPMTPGDGWHYTFIDRFNKGSLDERYWTSGWFAEGRRFSGPVSASDASLIDSDNVSFGPDGMTLRLTRDPVTVGKLHKKLRGALVSTMGKVEVRPGCVIGARLKLPGSDGAIWGWPAFWTNSTQWPKGEIDIAEGLGGTTRWYMHYGTEKHHQHYGGVVAGDYVGWHDFRCHWETDRMDFYFDDRIVGRVTNNIWTGSSYLVLGIGCHPDDVPNLTTPADLVAANVYVMRRD